jgi:hypothetical protein
MDNRREKGKQLEYLVAQYLKDIENYVRPTKASGASTELGDIKSSLFLIECKNWDTKNVIINKQIWDKLNREYPIDSARIPLLVQSNNAGDVFVSLKLADFFEIVNKAYKDKA